MSQDMDITVELPEVQPTVTPPSLTASPEGTASGSAKDSIHNPNNKNNGPSPSDTTEGVKKSTPRQVDLHNCNWVTVTKAKGFPVCIPLESLPGSSDDEKKSLAYSFLTQQDKEITNFGIKKINTIQMIGASFKTIEDATAACSDPVTKDSAHPCSFVLVSNLNKDENRSFYVAVYDVPLDIDKAIFKLHMAKYGSIKTIRFAVFKLHYTVHITFSSYDEVFPKLGQNWSIRFNKDSFRIWPENLNKQEYQKRHNNVLKLTNLPKGTRAFDLREILEQVGAMTCYIPKKGNTDAYQQDRVAYIAFRTNNDKERVFRPVVNPSTNVLAPPVFLLNNRALAWTHVTDKCCYECGSKYHVLRDCKEHRQVQLRKHNQERYRPIQQRYGAVSKPRVARSISRGRSSTTPNYPVGQRYNHNNGPSYAQTVQSIRSDSQHDYFYPSDNRRSRSRGPNKGKDKMPITTSGGPSSKSNFTDTSPSNPPLISAPSTGFQLDTNNRLNKLEKGLNEFATQLSTLANAITGIQKFITGFQSEINDKLNAIITRLPAEKSRDVSPIRKAPYSRMSNRKSNPNLRQSSGSSSVAAPSGIPTNIPIPIDPQSARIDSLEQNLTKGLQQVADASAAITSIGQFVQQQQSARTSNPPDWDFDKDVAAKPFEYEEDLNDSEMHQ